MVHRGDALIAVCGGTDAGVTALNAMAFGVIGAIAPPGDNPARAVRPFDANRKGTAGGEGCGILVLERLEHALARGARIYAEVAGFGATEDAYHLTAPAPDAEFAALAISRAIEDAGLRPEDVDHISAHGTGTPLNDTAETAAIKRALGDHAYRVTVSGIKAMVGHTAGAPARWRLSRVLKASRPGWSRQRSTTKRPIRPATSTMCPTRRAARMYEWRLPMHSVSADKTPLSCFDGMKTITKRRSRVGLTYFERVLERRRDADPVALAAFGRHVHFGFWDNPARADGSIADFARAADALTLRIIKAANVRSGQRVLDVGCGIGGTLALLNEHFDHVELLGLNIDPSQIEQARHIACARPGNMVDFSIGDAMRLPYADESFDTVLAVECSFHFPQS